MPTQREKIIKKVREILENSPQGRRYSELFHEIHNTLPEVKENTIHTTLWELRQDILKGKILDISQPERGVYILSKYLTKETKKKIEIQRKLKEIEGRVKEVEILGEHIFYGAFADFLVQDLGECTKAVSLGSNKFQDKWGTPDVLGIYKFSETDPIKPPIEIISAEIKTDTSQLITAFGQACAYKLFSHKVYLVIPKDAERDISRVESLCLRFGLGLILFDKNNPKNPQFEIRTRAVKSEPDYFYVNEYLRRLDKKDLEKLF